jgi:hypothetical protein
MLTPQERQEMIARMRKLPEILEAAVKDLNDAQLDTPYGEGKWTVRQVVHHLADSHMQASARVKLILTEDKPTFKPYNQNEWARLPDSMKAPIAPSLVILKALHQRWCDLLTALPENAWQRNATHPERGVVTLDDQLRVYSRHGENHVDQIARLRTAKGW